MGKKILFAAGIIFMSAMKLHAAFLSDLTPVNLAEYPQVPPRISAAETLPTKFDLRDEKRLTPIKDQRPWGTCWTFATTAAMESNYLTNHKDVDPENLDLSEMHMIWFSRLNQGDKSRNFSMYNMNKAKLIHMGDYGCALEQGSYTNIALAYLSRLDGPVNENNFPYLDKNYFEQFGFNINNPPAHAQAETAGMIPVEKSSTPYDINYANSKKITPQKNLMLTDALFAASVAVPALFANQRRDYAVKNRVNNRTLKELVKEYGAAMVSYYSAENTRTNLNATTHAYYYKGDNAVFGNHEIAIVGWDDDFPKENFLIQPENNGAWLARNNWGNFNGSDNGYEWISYEQFIGDGTVCVVKERPENLHTYEYDPLGWCNSYSFSEKDMWAANVFKVDSEGEILKYISYYTTTSNMKVEIKIYNLGSNWEGKDPTAGNVIFSKDDTIYYAGYHTLETSQAALTRNNYFSVVIHFTYTNGVMGENADTAVEVAINGYSNNAAVYDKESFFSANGKTWDDGTSLVNSFSNNVPYHVNACIKAFTIAPNFTSKVEERKTIMNIPAEKFWTLDATMDDTKNYNNIGTSMKEKVNLTVRGTGEVNFYLVDKNRTEQPVFWTTDDEIEELLEELGYSHGISGPSTIVMVSIFATGYTPDVFMVEDGITYPAYGPFTATANASGTFELDVNNLKYTNGKTGRIPLSLYYTVLCETSSGSKSEIGFIELMNTTNTNPNSNTTPASGDRSGGGGGGSGGGCNTGLAILCAGIIFVKFRKR